MLECVTEYDLKYCGDSVEWCPIEGYQNLLACGSYQLDPESSQRVGKIDLFRIENNTLTLLQEIELDVGLLDAKWAHHTQNNVVLLAAALSSGYLHIYKLVNNKLILASSLDVCTNGMALAVDWSTGVKADCQPRLVVSQSNGSISIIQLTEDGSLIKLNELKGHTFEAWSAAFNYWDTNICYSGGDDCKFNVYDIRSMDRPILTNASHNVGVTSLQCNQKYEGFLASGSYDDVRIWNTSSGLLDIDLEGMKGGSWRVKWNASGNCCKLAVAGMHDGFSTIDYNSGHFKKFKDYTTSSEEVSQISEEISNIKIVSEDSNDKKKMKSRLNYKGPHTSLGYGIDWSFEDPNIIAACSFYDKKLSIARLKM